MKNVLQIQRISPSELDSFDMFKRDQPVVIAGGCKDWPASEKWGMDFFQDNYGEIELPLSNYKDNPYQPAYEKPNVKLKLYLDEVRRILNNEKTSSDDLYSAGWYFTKGNCELLKDLNIPKVFEENWAHKVQKILYIDTTSLLFGHPRVESPLHTDSFFVSTWFACIVGQKRIRLVEPRNSEHVCNGFNVFDDAKVEELDQKGVSLFDATIGQGDIFWFPPGWWHHVKNDSFTISVTTNFVSAHHFLPFEQQVRSTLLKPLLGLAKLRQEAMLRSVPDVEELASLSYSRSGIRDSKYVDNERKYLHFMTTQAKKTSKLLEHLEI